MAVRLEVRTPSEPPAGNLQAWARSQRYGAAAQLALARGADVAAGHTATDQVETILYRLASSPSRRALLGMRARDGALVRPLLPFTREQTAAYCLARALSGARMRPTTRRSTPAAACAERSCRRCGRSIRRPRRTCSRSPRCCATRRRCSTRRSTGAGRPARDRTRKVARAAARARRLVVQRLADGAAGQPAPGAARRVQEILALGDSRRRARPAARRQGARAQGRSALRPHAGARLAGHENNRARSAP